MARTDVTVPMPDELVEAIEQELDYGDSRAEWIREACRERLERAGRDIPDGAQTDGGQTMLCD